MKIITANYRDRDSFYPWLVRGSEEHPSDAIEVKSLLAKNVTFRPAVEELDDGCDIVGQIGSDNIQILTSFTSSGEGFRRMTFSSGSFYDRELHEHVDEVSELYLDPTGKMWYKPKVAVAAPQAPSAATASAESPWKNEGFNTKDIAPVAPDFTGSSFRLDDIAESGLKLAVRGTKNDEFLLWESERDLYLTINSFTFAGFMRAATAVIDSTTLQKLLLVVEQEEVKAAIEAQSAGVPEGFTLNTGEAPIYGRLVEVIYNDGERAIVSSRKTMGEEGFVRISGDRYADAWNVSDDFAAIKYFRVLSKEEVLEHLFPDFDKPDTNAGLDDDIPF